MYTEEQMLANVIYDVLKSSSIDEILAVWNTVKSVYPESTIRNALRRADEDYDGTVDEAVRQWIFNNEQDVVEAERALAIARERLAEVKMDVKKHELEASDDKATWEKLVKTILQGE